MTFCPKCGAQIQEGVAFCPSCGQSTVQSPAPPPPPAPQYAAPPPLPPPPAGQVPPAYAPPQQQYQQQPGYGPPVMPGVPLSPEQDAQQNKGMAILAYLIFFVPLIAGTHKTSPYVKYHTNQGTVLAIFSIGCSIVFGILQAIILAIFTASLAFGALLAFTTIFGLLWFIIGIFILVLVILGIVNASGGKIKPLPVIGKFTIIK